MGRSLKETTTHHHQWLVTIIVSDENGKYERSVMTYANSRANATHKALLALDNDYNIESVKTAHRMT